MMSNLQALSFTALKVGHIVYLPSYIVLQARAYAYANAHARADRTIVIIIEWTHSDILAT